MDSAPVLGQNSLKGVVISIFIKNGTPRITTVQRVVSAIGFIGSFRSEPTTVIPAPIQSNNDS